MSFHLYLAQLQAALDTVEPQDWRVERVETFIRETATPLREKAEFLNGELEKVRERLAVEYRRLGEDLGWLAN